MTTVRDVRITHRRPGPSTRVRVRERTGDRWLERDDRLTTEEPLEIRLGWPGREPERLTVTMRTPGHDFELTAGFLLGEGLVSTADDLDTISYCTDHALRAEEQYNVVTARLSRPPRRPLQQRYDGPGGGSSACGVCGKQRIEDVLDVGGVPVQRRRPPVEAAVVPGLASSLRRAQRQFDATGGLHAAGLFDRAGTPLVVREDIGRHNAVDKAVGARLLRGEHPAPVMCVSGRLGFELVQKAVAAGIEMVAAVGAPSSLAVQLAQDAGVCAVGFVRDDRFVVYSHPDQLARRD